jgi:hypothetical protein
MNKVIKFLLITGFVFLAAGFISSLFFHNSSIIERLSSAIKLMATVGFAEFHGPRVPGIICSISGLFAFLLLSVGIILFVVRWIIRMSVKEIDDAKIKSS